jgi:hypothetical protein
MYFFDDLPRLQRAVATASSSTRNAEWTRAMAEWMLVRLVDLSRSRLSRADILNGHYTYQPQVRQFIAGDPTPSTCESDPQEVDTRHGVPLTVQIHSWEKKYRICRTSKLSNSLADDVREGEFAVAMSLGHLLFSEFWYGLPAVGSFGIFTHPLGTTTASPNGASGKQCFKEKTANEIFGELRDAMKGMDNPQLVMSEQAWLDGADKILAGGDRCARLGDCLIQKLTQSEATGGFTSANFSIMKFLDDVTLPDATNLGGVFIVWDQDSVDFPASLPVFISPLQQKKRVDQIREISSAGTIVKFTDSLRIVTGINDCT